MHPRVKVTLQTPEQLWTLATHLFIAAGLSNRVMVWPQLECLSKPVIKQDTFNASDTTWPSPIWDPNYVTFGNIQDMRCLTTEFMSRGCNQVGLQWYDFDHYRKVNPGVYKDAVKENILLMDAYIPSTETRFLYGADVVAME